MSGRFPGHAAERWLRWRAVSSATLPQNSAGGGGSDFYFCRGLADCALGLEPDARDPTQPSGSSNRKQGAKPRNVPSEVNDLAGLRNLAEQGDPAAQFALGARYATGEERQTGLHRGGALVYPGGGSGTHPGTGDSGRVLLGGQRRVART